MATYRHEYKYFAPEYMLTALEQRAKAVLRPDAHVGSGGFYSIRSLYFDDIYNTCFKENENGTDPREKFRIRIYNNSPERIALELKRKQQGKTLKLSCPISYGRCEALLRGEVPEAGAGDDFLYKKLVMQMRLRGLRPVTIVSYERVPYLWAQGNVRVTFDRNVRSADDFSRFFDGELPSRPILPEGTNLLEVKFDAFLPDFVFEILQTGRLNQTTFSKYYLCRKYNSLGAIYAYL